MKNIDNNNKNHATKVIALLLLFASLIISLISCGEYQTFTLKRGIAHFSFEYPARYGVDIVEIEDNPKSRYTDILLGWSPPERLWRSSNINICVLPGNSANAEAALEYRLGLENKPAFDFKLLERYSVTVSGVDGYGAFYSRIAPPLGPGQGPPGEPRLIIHRSVYFSYGGLIWSIYVGYDEATKDLGEADYEHVIKTFKILE